MKSLLLITVWTLAAGVATADSSHWAFRPLRPPAKTETQPQNNKNPIDRFIDAGLRKKGLTPAPAADRRTLIRRVTFDLIGLPPAPEEIRAFLQDKEAGAFERLVDRLLASPHFGERWGRRWLDIARYADSEGRERDDDRRTAYHYRDFVIWALNEDLPFDQFVRWQLAGDEIEPDNPRAIAATGFVVAGPHAILDTIEMQEERIRERYNDLDDMLSTTGSAFLGLSIGCARCHDHKYDPITIRDYYRMSAAFNAGDRAEVPLTTQQKAAEWRAARDKWNVKMEAAKKVKDEAAVKRLEQSRPVIATALAVRDFSAQPAETWLLDRGSIHVKSEKVGLGFIASMTARKRPEQYLAEARTQGTRTDTTYQRMALAAWITDIRNGPGALLARVAVNRLWQGHFGEGIVRSVNDFGRRADPPSHPELLEWLAAELVNPGVQFTTGDAGTSGQADGSRPAANGAQGISAPHGPKNRTTERPSRWSLKHIHRLIVTSEAYKRGTAYDGKSARVDPENRLWWRRRPLRLEAEVFRDSMLAVAGTLNRQMFGPAFKPPIPAEAQQARNLKDPYPKDAKDTPDTRRRSVYMFHKRVVPYPLLQAFDGPDASTSCGRRNVTTVAPQALAVLNEPFIRLRAAELAERLGKEPHLDARIRTAYMLALGRSPNPPEREAGSRFIQEQTSRRRNRDPKADAEKLALTDFAQVLFGSNEFLYVD